MSACAILQTQAAFFGFLSKKQTLKVRTNCAEVPFFKRRPRFFHVFLLPLQKKQKNLKFQKTVWRTSRAKWAFLTPGGGGRAFMKPLHLQWTHTEVYVSMCCLSHAGHVFCLSAKRHKIKKRRPSCRARVYRASARCCCCCCCVV